MPTFSPYVRCSSAGMLVLHSFTFLSLPIASFRVSVDCNGQSGFRDCVSRIVEVILELLGSFQLGSCVVILVATISLQMRFMSGNVTHFGDPGLDISF